MASARFAWGIDVGNRALKAVKLVRDGDNYRVDEFEVIEHETVLSNAGDNKDALVQTALASFAQRHSLKGGVVAAGVSGQSSFARFIKLPPVEPKKIPEIVRFEAIQQIPFPLDDVEWSYQLFENPESPDVEVGIFAMRKELVNQHIKFFTDIDMNVQVVQMNPLAVYNALQHDGKFERGTTMVIDLGAENTDLLIADNDSIWMRSIPIGGNNFTETLVKAFKLNFAKAEDLKRNSATSKYARQIFQAMRPIFADLVAEIQRSIGFYSSVHRDSRIKKVIALGGTFRLPGLQKYLQQNLQMDVERLDNITANPPTDPKLVGAFNENLLSCISAYGLALQAMDSAKITSSLLPSAIRREKMWQEKTKWFAAAAALFCVGTGLAVARYLFTDFQFAGGNKEFAARIDDVKKRATDLDSQWTQIESSGTKEVADIKEAQNLGKYRTLWADLLVDLYGSLPAQQRTVASTQAATTRETARRLRPAILIDSMTSRYDEALGAKIKDPDFARYASIDATGAMAAPVMPAAPGAAAAAPAPTDPNAPQIGNGLLNGDAARGFLVVLHCTSPTGTAMDPNGLVFKEFVDRLMLIKPNEKRTRMEYGVARAAVGTSSVRKIKDNPQRMTQLKTQYDAILRAQQAAAMAAQPKSLLPGQPGAGGTPNGGFGQRPGQQPGPGGYDPNGAGSPIAAAPSAAAIEAEAYKDPLTGESVLNDWEFDIVIAVVIDPPPATPAAPGAPGAPTASAQ